MLEAVGCCRFWLKLAPWFAVVCLFALGPPAQASSCHQPDRPTLGIALLPWGEPSSFSIVADQPPIRSTPALHRLPCPGDQPSPTARPWLAPSAVESTLDFVTEPDLEDSVEERAASWPPLALFLPLERPPR